MSIHYRVYPPNTTPLSCHRCGRPRVTTAGQRTPLAVHDGGNGGVQCNCDSKALEIAEQRRTVDGKPDTSLTRIRARGEDHVAAQFTTSLRWLGFQHYWMALIPSRIGHLPALDAAAFTLSLAQQHLAKDRHDRNTLKSVRRHYGQTIRLLYDMSNDAEATFITMAILGVFDGTMALYQEGWRAHMQWTSLPRILTSLPVDIELGEVSRAIIFSAYDITFNMPISLGTPSQFEDQRWLRLEPAYLRTLPAYIVTLEKLRYQASIRAPRLTMYLRALRQRDHCASVPDAEAAIRLAEDLLVLEDRTAEAQLLHGVELVPTEDHADSFIVPFSLQFRNPTEYRVAVLYWIFRLVITTLAIELATLTSTPDLDATDVWTAQTRSITNLFMSWQYAKSQGLPATVDLFQGYLVVWASLFQRMSFKGMPILSVKAWLLPKLEHPFISWTNGASQQTVDFAADVLVGGPLPASPAAGSRSKAVKGSCCAQWSVHVCHADAAQATDHGGVLFGSHTQDAVRYDTLMTNGPFREMRHDSPRD